MNAREGRIEICQDYFFCVFKENNMPKRNVFFIELYSAIETLSDCLSFSNKTSLQVDNKLGLDTRYFISGVFITFN